MVFFLFFFFCNQQIGSHTFITTKRFFCLQKIFKISKDVFRGIWFHQERSIELRFCCCVTLCVTLIENFEIQQSISIECAGLCSDWNCDGICYGSPFAEGLKLMNNFLLMIYDSIIWLSGASRWILKMKSATEYSKKKQNKVKPSKERGEWMAVDKLWRAWREKIRQISSSKQVERNFWVKSFCVHKSVATTITKFSHSKLREKFSLYFFSFCL